MPEISVIINTARSGYSMLGLPGVHHFKYTIDALKRQSYKNFELIISDYIWDKRQFDWDSIKRNFFPIYHVPITHSIFKKHGYVAISGTKNNGIMYAEGNILIFLDDCCTFESNFIARIIEAIKLKKIFPNAWHKKEIGSEIKYDGNGNPVIDSRYVLFDHYQKDIIIDNFHMYGYSSMTLEAALKVNGFDELMDGSRQLEDIDMGERLKRAGFHISFHKDIFVVEQEHTDLAPEPDARGENPWSDNKKEDPVKFNNNLKCNGPFHFIKNERKGNDSYLANHRPLNAVELEKVRNCFLLSKRDDGSPLCRASNGGCNWIDKHMKDSMAEFLIVQNPPVFSLEEERKKRLAEKKKYLVCKPC